MTRTFVALAVSVLTSAPLLAAPTGGLDYAPPVAPAPPDIASLVFRLILMTLVLVGVCGSVLWFARRANRPAGATGDGSGRMKHEGTLALDRTCAVHLLWVDGLTVALTTDATGLRSLVLLSEPFDAALDAAQQADAALEPEPPAPQPAPAPTWSADDVGRLLQRLVSRAAAKPTVSG